MKSHTVKIEKIIHGGHGLGRLTTGQVVIVKHVLPGETVRLRIIDQKKKFATALLEEVLESSPARRTPPCPYYTVCGGCDFQHMDYATQLRIKQQIVTELLARSFPTMSEATGVPVADTLPSPHEWGYRQRIRLQPGPRDGLGFLRFRSHQVVPIDRCLLAAEPLNTVLEELNESALFARLLPHTKELELLVNPKHNGVICLLHTTRKPRPADKGTAIELTATSGVEQVYFKGEDFPLTGPFTSDPEKASKLLHNPLTLEGGDTSPFHLAWEVGGFCQVNLAQNNALVQHALRCSNLSPTESVLDLFCGMGNFSLPLASQAASLLGIEGQGSAIRSATRNSRDNNLTNTTFVKKPVHAACRELARQNHTFDCVVLDPPRQGVPGIAKEIASLARRCIVYISCDPATLCRDLNQFDRHGFAVKTVQPVDMFPHTHHIESVVLLEKN